MAHSRLSPHFAAISPYFNVFRQPPTPSSHKVFAAAYLSRHGIIQVSSYDYHQYILPFLTRVKDLQRVARPSFTGPLSFLNTYQSWITEAHVGGLSDYGRRQCYDLGSAFRVRYQQLFERHRALQEGLLRGKTANMAVMSDSAARCQLSASEFARSFARGSHEQDIDVSVAVIDAEKETDPRNNLSWHTTYEEVDQTQGQAWMEGCMTDATAAALSRLKDFWPGQLEPRDVYAMQLLHCYDTCARLTSPWMEPIELFTARDWEGFEYLRDGKYHFSEGRGARKATGRYALPWLVSAMHHLKAFSSRHEDLPPADNGRVHPTFPLQMSFTHREEVLYLCSLLGLGCYVRKTTGPRRLEAWEPSSFGHDATTTRPWHVSTMACYLGHVGIEAYAVQEGKHEQVRVRIILNGTVAHDAFPDEPDIRPCEDGGYGWEAFEELVHERAKRWEHEPPAGLPDRSCVWKPLRHSTQQPGAG